MRNTAKKRHDGKVPCRGIGKFRVIESKFFKKHHTLRVPVGIVNVIAQTKGTLVFVTNSPSLPLCRNSNFKNIAQEVEKIMPELVSEDTWVDGTKRKFLSTEKMVPFIVAAMKEQQIEIDKLKAKLEHLGQ